MESALELDLRLAVELDFELGSGWAVELDFELAAVWGCVLEYVSENVLDGVSAMAWDSNHRGSCTCKYPCSKHRFSSLAFFFDNF